MGRDRGGGILGTYPGEHVSSETATLTKQDEEYLRLLSIGHYIVAGLQALSGFFPVFHLGIGIWMLTSPEMHKKDDAFPAFMMGGLFVVFAAAFMLFAWSLAAALVVAGRSIAQRRRRVLCMVVAALTATTCMPFGTVLGVLSLVLLTRPAVQAAFDRPSQGGA